jgi:NADPH:quinone reductase-like Zn-dependent oxidoreductase
MNMEFDNLAAWLQATATPFTIKHAPLVVPENDQVLVRNRAVAINPSDGKIQYLSLYPLQFPTILGQDVAGEVVAVGPNVTRFKKGDRVLGNTAGFEMKRTEEMGFQLYTILRTQLTCKIPDAMPFENAAVLPLAISTASSGLFQEHLLGLQLPTSPPRSSTKQTLLVWGGASCVGNQAIQLAVAAGYNVITTASPKNFSMVKNLGAAHTFDYNCPTVIEDLVRHVKSETRVIIGMFDAVGASSQLLRVAELLGIATTILTTVPRFPEAPKGITIKKVYAPDIMHNHVGRAIYESFLQGALESGSYVASPPPLIAGHGLESLQDAIHRQQEGVSAQKVVVLL